MDIAGAKALKRRLGPNGGAEDPRDPVDVPEDAPPVYHWTGVSKPSAETSDDDVEDETSTASFFRRLGLGFR
jgi:hypothetical protein